MDDINATQVIGQMLGAGLISKEDARRMHPHVRDPEGTGRQLLVDQLEDFALQALAMRAQQGLAPIDYARIIDLIYEGHPLHVAIAMADREAQERQASLAPPAPPGMATAPESQPGLAQPGEGAEAQPSVQPPGQGLENLRALVGALRSPGGA